VKTLKLALIVSFIVVMFASVSIVSAAAMEGTAVGYWSVTHPTPGRQVTLTVTFDSSSTQTLYLYAIGVHGDWMESGRFYGPDLSDDPVPVAPGQPYSAKIILDIPVTASLGEHEYYIGVDGVKENGESFSWDSPTYTVTFDVSSAPTPTGQPNSGSTNPPTDGGLNNMLVYVAVIAVVAVVAIVLAIFIVKRSGKKPDAPAESFPPESTFVPPPASPKPEQKPKAEPMPDPEPEPAPELTEPEDTEPESKDFTI
jgi:hypothetical protein